MRAALVLAAAAAFLAAFFMGPAHADGRLAKATYICLHERTIMQLAALDERHGRTVNDLVGLMREQMLAHECFSLQPAAFRKMSLIYEYKDADGEPSEVWSGFLPEATRLTFTIIMVADEASEA
jgi:hypothetical protein